jgi:hypothetical protein
LREKHRAIGSLNPAKNAGRAFARDQASTQAEQTKLQPPHTGHR